MTTGWTGQTGRSDIAIVGMSGRFPGAKNIEAFWQNLKDGVESRTVITDDELRAQGVPSSYMNYPGWVKSGFTLDDIEMFDAGFFGLNPREAQVIDPQHRIFLECAWEALEYAGYDTERYDGAVAVFGGSTFSGYLQNNVLRNARIVKAVGGRQAVYGSVPDYMVTRVSYKLNLRGPCYFVQSACSTSLVAVHLACQSLHDREADIALAGGVSVAVPHRLGYVYEEGGMLSPDGICRTFDIGAKGTVFGSGVGIVVLKRLSDALADGDHIHAVIRGAATNNDGAFKVGFTAPSVVGQAQVVAEAMANAGVDPESISYVEAHGTGTELGDPIEISALTRAHRASTDRKGYCAVGSVKPNVGHLDAAAGVSSLIKTVLALEHRQMPPTINYEHPNPKIDFENSPFFVNTVLRPWPANGSPRRAGVSSFGFGGTNAHVIVEEAPPLEPSGPSRSHQLLVLSAKSEAALEAATSRLGAHLIEHSQTNLADAAFTLQVGRRLFKNRRAVVCATVADAIDALQGADPRSVITGEAASKDRPIVFMFPGQGAQYVNMGLELYQQEPVFRAVVDECSEQLLPHIGFDLRGVLYPPAGPSDEASERLKQTAVTQCALFVIELAMARLWMSWGVKPAAMIGHSIGEFVAGCLSGVLTLPDALRLVALRGRLMGEMEPGTMLAVPLPESQVSPLLDDGLWLAAVNAPSLSVVSGLKAAIETLGEHLRLKGVESRALHTSHAFHSGMMDGAVGVLVDAARTVEIGAPQIPYISNVTGTWITEAQVRDPEYWGRHVRQCVRFSDGVAELMKDPDRLYLELGPGGTLGTLVRQQVRSQSSLATIATMRGPHEEASDEAFVLGALGRLFLSGASVNWAAFYANEKRRRVVLPAYPFERSRYWVEADKPTRANTVKSLSQVEQLDFSDWFYSPSWKRSPSRAMPSGAGAEPRGTCLIFADEPRLGARVTDRAAELGFDAVVVEPAAGFVQADDRHYAIAPGERADYVSLMNALKASNRTLGAVVHLWGVGESDRGADTTRACEERGFYSLLYLAQAIGELGVTSPIRMAVATQGVHEVTGQERLLPERAVAIGPCRVIPQEFPNIACRQIDLDTSTEVSDVDVKRLVAELLDKSADPIAAYRGGRRWVRTFEPLHLEPSGDKLPAALREEGVYLITGGLGGIGLVLARHLARVAKARLILTGRRGLPPREQWADYVASRGREDGISRKIQAVQALEADGAEVFVGSADVVDERAMRAVVDEACARFGRIDGVVHAAGVAGGGMIQLKTREIADAVLAPKVTGTQVLERVLAGRPLDFLLLCSSLTGVLGGVGQVDYCAANAYLDAFAHFHAAKTGTVTISVNWNAWREVGMAVDTDVPESLRATLKGQMLAVGITNAEGVDAFSRILSQAGDPQVALSPFDVQLLIEAQSLTDGEEELSQQTSTGEAAAGQNGAHPRPSLQTAYIAPVAEAEQKLCKIWAEALGIERVGTHDNFFDLGGHSLLAVQVMGQVNKALNTSIPVAKLYEGLTVAFLAGLLKPAVDPSQFEDDDADLVEKRREKSRRQKEHQLRRRVALGR